MSDTQSVIGTLTVAVDIARDYPRLSLATIGGNLKRIRGSGGQKAIAERVNKPVTLISNWERDRYEDPKLTTLLEMAAGYQCSVEEILNGVRGYQRPTLSQAGSTVGPSSGGPHDDSQHQTRLLKRIAELEAALSQTKDVARRLIELAAVAHKGRSTRRKASGDR